MSRKPRILLFLTIGLLAALMAVPALAGAQEPTDEQYTDDPQQVQNQVEQGGTANEADPQGGGSSTSVGSDPSGEPAGGVASTVEGRERVVSALPFTGLDLIAMVVAAVVLVGTGLLLRQRRGVGSEA